MPSRPPSLKPRKAERERKRAIDQRRGSSTARGYDAAWRAVRDEVIIERACICEFCGKLGARSKREASSVLEILNVDHRKSIEERPDLRLEKSNLRVAHHSCHSRRTARDQGFARRGAREG
jgi:5-methylcytosine-specific restriction protein A